MRNLTVALLLLSACRDVSKESGLEETNTPKDTQVENTDADGDGFGAHEDCNDSDSSIHPDAIERCDGVDNDCDGLLDDDDPQVIETNTWYLDFDQDGFGEDMLTMMACDQPDGFVDNHQDCQDADEDVHPDAVEICDGMDNDCDDVTDGPDSTDALTWYSDTDGDGYGTIAATVTACDPPAGFALHDGDCDDEDPAFHPGALESDCADPTDYNCDGSVGFTDADNDGFAACEDCDDSDGNANDDAAEICDGVDNDCDGLIDSDDPDTTGTTTWYADADGDGHGGLQFELEACEAAPGYVASNDDCDDLDENSYPGGAEVCDDADNDCDNDVDEGVGNTWYADSDSDGYGNGSVSAVSCDAPSGYVSNALDCDDFSSTTNPGSYEICDGADNDCDGTSDEDAINATTWYVDGDADGYGSSVSSTQACAQPSGHAGNNTDCNDSETAINPGATETCDSIDNDCDGSTDEDAINATTWYVDSDADGYGSSASATTACSQPSGHVDIDGDCNDTENTINPGATETCDSIDNDCDGSIDQNAVDIQTWYADADSDSYGNPSVATTACSAPSGYVSDNTDCDDSTSSVNPGATETWYDGVDTDCAGDNDNDADGDGAESYQDASGTDCDDSDASAIACGSTPGTALSSCNALLSIDSSLGDGAYWIDPDGGSTSNAFQAYCDMTTSNGGWTMVFNIVNTTDCGTSCGETYVNDYADIPHSLTDDKKGITASALSDLRNQISFGELRFRCYKNNVGRTIDIAANSTAVLDYFTARTNTHPSATGSFTLMPDDNANQTRSPGSWGYHCGNGYNSDTWSHCGMENEQRLGDHAFFIGHTSHWNAPYSNRWECDDYSAPDVGYWRVFVR